VNVVPQNAEYFLTSRGPVSFSRRTLLHGVSFVVNCAPELESASCHLYGAQNLQLEPTFLEKFVDPVHYSSPEVTGTVPTRHGRGWVANTNKCALNKPNTNRPHSEVCHLRCVKD